MLETKKLDNSATSSGILLVWGAGGLGFESGYPQVTILFIRRSEESKPTNPYHQSTSSWKIKLWEKAADKQTNKQTNKQANKQTNLDCLRCFFRNRTTIHPKRRFWFFPVIYHWYKVSKNSPQKIHEKRGSFWGSQRSPWRSCSSNATPRSFFLWGVASNHQFRNENVGICTFYTVWFLGIFLYSFKTAGSQIPKKQGEQRSKPWTDMSHEKKPSYFALNPGSLIGILVIVYYDSSFLRL